MAMSEWKNVNSGYTIPLWMVRSANNTFSGRPYDTLTLDVSDYSTVTFGDIIKGSGCNILQFMVNGTDYGTAVGNIPRSYDVDGVDTFTITLSISLLAQVDNQFQLIDITVS